METKEIVETLFGALFTELGNFLRVDVKRFKPQTILVTRNFLGLTQQEMAGLLKIRKETLVSWEEGTCELSMKWALKFFLLSKMIEWKCLGPEEIFRTAILERMKYILNRWDKVNLVHNTLKNTAMDQLFSDYCYPDKLTYEVIYKLDLGDEDEDEEDE